METILKIRSEVHETLKKNPIQILRTNKILPYEEKVDYINILPDKESLLFFVPNDPKHKTSVAYESSIKFDGLFLQNNHYRTIQEAYNSLILFTDNILEELFSENYNKWYKNDDQHFKPFKTFKPVLFGHKSEPEIECTQPELYMHQGSAYYFSFMIFGNASTKGLALANKIAPSTLSLCEHLKSEVPYELRRLGIFPGYKIYKKHLDNIVREELE